MANDVMLSTSDNKFDPFTEFDEWLHFDEEHRYNTCGLIARIGRFSDELSEEDNDAEYEDAIDRIVDHIPVANAQDESVKYVKIFANNAKE